MNRSAQQKDNSDLLKKVQLRRCFCKEVDAGNVFLAGAGFGEMFRHVWRDKAQYTLALDTNQLKIDDFLFHFPGIDARVGDCNVFCDWPSKCSFNVADFDSFGDVYPGIRHFFDSAPWRTPFYVVVADSGPLAFKRRGHVSQELRHKRYKEGVWIARDLASYVERLVWPWWGVLSRNHRLAISCRAYVANKEKTVAYYALKLDSIF